jgi:hypothetical protein
MGGVTFSFLSRQKASEACPEIFLGKDAKVAFSSNSSG